MSWSDGLRDAQVGAAGADRGHAVLLAGPGTGKTFVLVRRIQFLIEEQGVDPSRITSLTFSRAAAAEMRSRLEDVLGDKAKKVRVSTLHAYSLGQLLRHGGRQLPAPLRVANDREERFIVVEELAGFLRRRVDEISNRRDGALERLADDWETLDADGSGWEDGFPDPGFLSMWRRHREVYGYTLRSELVYQLLTELRTDPALEPPATDVLVVDEYQDLNKCDLRTISLLAERADAEVFAAGDDDQSIYSFRHAAPAGIREFTETYGTASRLVLSECLRCGPDVVAIGNWLIEQETDREPKELASVTDWGADVHFVRLGNQFTEAAAVAKAVEHLVTAGIEPHQILVLAKSDFRGRISQALEAALREAEIRVYMPRGRDVSENLQRLLEYLALVSGLTRDGRTDDLALRALLELEDNGTGTGRIRSVVEIALEKGIRFSEAIEHVRGREQEYRRSRMNELVTAADTILGIAERMLPTDGETFDDWLTRVSEALSLPDADFRWLLEASRDVADDAATLEMSSVDEVDIASVAEAQTTSTSETEAQTAANTFVQDLLSIMSNVSDIAPPVVTGQVTFTSMHGAKGLTADVVFVLQAEDEVIPGDVDRQAEDEARRLMYVSPTRARKLLIVAACDRRTGDQRFVGSEEVAERTFTRFLRDYPVRAMNAEGLITSLRDYGVG